MPRKQCRRRPKQLMRRSWHKELARIHGYMAQRTVAVCRTEARRHAADDLQAHRGAGEGRLF
eukprot:1369011-Pyramimonas_sp.AAC.1